METNTESKADETVKHHSSLDDNSVAVAARGRKITGLDIFQSTSDNDNITAARVVELMSKMNADVPTGGDDLTYGTEEAHRVRYWKSKLSDAPLILFIHGGSWRIGTYLDSIGSKKVTHLVDKGYAVATVNYSLVPVVTVEEQVQEVANSLGYLIGLAARLEFDPERIVLMGHSSGAHVSALLGTDISYLDRAGVSIHNIHGVIALDGSNYNAMAELIDSPGPVAENMLFGLGSNPQRLRDMSPLYHASIPNARAFLFLHVQRSGDIRQAVEFSASLNAVGTHADLHVFEGESFEGHMAMLLSIGNPNYPATHVLDDWLQKYVPIDSSKRAGSSPQ